jgi:hypothetical protein
LLSLLFLQEIISERYASAAEILEFRGAARDKNSEHGASPALNLGESEIP